MPNRKKVEVVENAKIVVLNAENPRREGTKAYERAQAVLLSKGQTVATALKKGAKTSTVRHMVEEGIVKLATPAPRKTSARRAA